MKYLILLIACLGLASCNSKPDHSVLTLGSKPGFTTVQIYDDKGHLQQEIRAEAFEVRILGNGRVYSGMFGTPAKMRELTRVQLSGLHETYPAIPDGWMILPFVEGAANNPVPPKGFELVGTYPQDRVTLRLYMPKSKGEAGR